MPDSPTVVLVTGAARGLGRAVAAQLAGQGHRVLISARDGEKAARAADELGDTVAAGHVNDPGRRAVAQQRQERPGAEAMGARPVDESARRVVRAATLPADGPSGGFFRDAQPLPW